MSKPLSRIIHKQLLGLGIGLIALLLPFNGMGIIATDVDGRGDDSELIVSRLKESLNSNGLISVEQHTGRLLFNPILEKLHTIVLKQKFLLPAMIVNQGQGLKMVNEVPFACFIISGGDLASDNYKGFRQSETARYIRDVKNFNISKVLICQTVGLTAARSWGQHLSLSIESDPFVFEEHVSISGEHFFYYLNVDGLFEMYM